ncbi:MAG: PAS domain-containing protein, partial [Proteobacteria bacterium]|nr:PAS domain-containing protein [Pseudomonadota bacterium]
HMLKTTDPRYERGRVAGYDAFAAFPILSGEKLLGVMSFAARSRSAFDAEALALFSALARYVAVVRSRLESESALREGEDKLRFAMDAAGQGSWELDLRTLKLTASDHCKRNFGRAPGDPFTYADVLAYVHPHDTQRVQQALQEAIETRSIYDIEYRYIRPAGNLAWVHVTGRPVYASDGKPLVMLGVSSDIDARKASELALVALNETLEQRVEAAVSERELVQSALRQSQKMEAMGQLTGGVAHDFNNLLMPIIGGLDILQRRVGNSERDLRLIEGALQSAERAKVLVQRLLAFARRQPLQPGAVDIGLLIGGMIDLIKSTSGHQFSIETAVAASLPPALADSHQLEMAILNLAVNARDAMPNGGTLTIEAAHESACPAEHSGLHGAPCIRLSVIDTGVGMDAETLKRAVEQFFSTKGIGKGTGLGLSMVHGLALQLGGGISISSQVGSGTQIDLWLPIGTSQVANPVAASDEPTLPRAAGRVLVVDDEDLVRRTTTHMLESIGFEVIQANSAHDAIKLLKAGDRFQLVVTDHLMPEISGAELAAIIAENWPSTKVLIISGYADLGGMPSGVALLTKPFREIDLANAISGIHQ